jgi:DNA-binding transcriptional MerR regulator
MGAQRPENLIDTKRRRKRVLELRQEGLTYAAIAEALEEEFGAERLPSSWGRSYVGQDLRRALKNVESDLEETAQNMLRLELRRLNELQRAFYEAALAGDTDAFDRVLKAMRRRAKYLGLDEPDELRATVGTDTETIETLLDALEEYPDARKAVAEALDKE